MRIFEHFNQSGDPCPICGTVDDKPPVLVAIHGTGDGRICEAMQIHLDCINLTAHVDGDSVVMGMGFTVKR